MTTGRINQVARSSQLKGASALGNAPGGKHPSVYRTRFTFRLATRAETVSQATPSYCVSTGPKAGKQPTTFTVRNGLLAVSKACSVTFARTLKPIKTQYTTWTDRTLSLLKWADPRPRCIGASVSTLHSQTSRSLSQTLPDIYPTTHGGAWFRNGKQYIKLG